MAAATLGSALAQDAKRGDAAPREDVEPFYGDASQSIAIQVPGFRGLEPDISLRYRSSRRDDLLGMGWTLGGFSTIEAASPRRGTPQHNSNDIFILDGQELVPCEPGMVSPSCATGGTHATKIESYLRIKLDENANTWEIWNREGTKIKLDPVIGQPAPPATPTNIIDADFASDEEGFVYSDDAFSGGSVHPNVVGSYAGQALNIATAGIDGGTLLDLTGTWSHSFTVPEEMTVSLTFDYVMTISSSYESDEYSQVLVSIDGGTPVVVTTLTGDGNGGANDTTGLQTASLSLGTLPAGTYSLELIGYNNKATISDETTDFSFDDVSVSGIPTAGPATPQVLLDAPFSSDEDGFEYESQAVGSGGGSNDYGEGTWSVYTTQAIEVRLASGLNEDVFDMSGGWTKSFTLAEEQDVTLAFDYYLSVSSASEPDEYGQALFSFDGGAPVVLESLNGGQPTTGWHTYTTNLGLLAPGTYSLSLGAYSNKTSRTDEWVLAAFDNVTVAGVGEAPLFDFATTYRWVVSEVVDTHGNTVSYSHFSDAGEVYPEAITYNGSEVKFYWEPRSDPFTTATGLNGLITTNHHLKAIDVQTGGNRVRSYALTYDAPLATTQEELLAAVQMYGKDAVLDANGNVTSGTSLPPTSFTYYDDPSSFAASTTWSTAHSGVAYKAESVQYADVNGDNLADRIFRTTSNQIHVSLSDGTQFAAPVQWAAPGGTYKNDQDSYADVNGDGLADLVFRKSNNQVGVYLSDGNGFITPSTWNAMGGSYYAGQVNLGDVDGDGRADLVFVGVTASHTDQTLQNTGGCQAPYDPTEFPFCPSGYHPIDTWTENGSCQQGEIKIEYYTKCRRTLYTEKLYLGLSGGSGFATPALQYNLTSASASATYHSDRVKLADVNGDGMTDLSYRTDGNNVKIGLSGGSSILPLASWYDFSGTYQAGQLQYADVNGDGTADALFHPVSSGCSQYTRTANRTGYPACDSGDSVVGFDTWTEETGPDGGSYTVYETTCEHCNASGSQIIQVSLSLGNDFLAPETWFTGVPGNAEPDLVKFADFDGDGKADLSYRSGSNAVTIALSTGAQFTTLETLPAFNGGYEKDQVQLADVNGDGKEDVIHRATNQTTKVALVGPAGAPAQALESVTNVYGGILTYAYTPSSAWDNTNLPFVVNTVTSVEADDGRGGVSTTTYDYAGGLWDAPERRFLGFRTATATLPCIAGEVDCPTVTTTFVQDFGAYSKPEKIERRDGAGTLLTMVEQEYSLNGATIPYTSLNTATTRTIYDGGQSRRKKTTRVFDDYANITESTFHGDFDQTGDELTSTSEFYPNTADYIVGLPARLRQYEGEGTAGAMLTEQVLYYDGATALTTAPNVGDLTMTKDWDDNTSSYVSSSIEYDSFGNVTAMIDPLTRRSEIDYDSTYNLFPVAARNPLYFGGDTRQTASTTWDELCGLPLTETDRNGQVTEHQYDQLCRGVRTDTPAGNYSISSYPNLGDPIVQYVERQTPTADNGTDVWSRVYLDGWGREVQSLVKGPSVGQEIAVDRTYNARGAIASVTRPYYLGGTTYTTTFDYDARNRETETQHPDLETVATAYGAGTPFTLTTTTDEVGHTTTLHRDAYGRVVRKEEPLGAGIVVETYEYGPLGRLTGLTDDAGNTWSYTYDSLGRRLSVDDPDLGFWSYVYDAAGQISSQTDAKGQTTNFTYDSLGRVLTKAAWNAATLQNEVTTYTYDEDRVGHFNVGHLTTAENATGKIEYDHNQDGRLARTTYAIDGNIYVFEMELDPAGRVLSQTYPDNDVVGPITYDAAGRRIGIPGVITSATYDARNWATSATRANGVVTIYDYSTERGWLEELQTLSGTITIQDFIYQRRADGQIINISSSFFGESWTYGYDDLKRLTSATNADVPAYSRSYAYDTVDNIVLKSDVGSYSYPIPGSPRPHAVTSAGGKDYSYDDNGNLVQVSESGMLLRVLVWDGQDRLTDIDGVTFHYGPDGARWKKVDTTGEVTLTLGEIEIQDAGTTNDVMVKYLPGGARRTGSGVGSETLWHHKDHLYSIRAVTDASGMTSLRRIHAPYGERIEGTGASFVEAKDYIGERLDEETGLLYLNARYYDPVLGRFISGDPSSPTLSGVGVNRYAYSLNNPIFYSDPYGLLSAGEREVAQMEERRAAREAAAARAAANGEVETACMGVCTGVIIGIGILTTGAVVTETNNPGAINELGQATGDFIEGAYQGYQTLQEMALDEFNAMVSETPKKPDEEIADGEEEKSTDTPAAEPNPQQGSQNVEKNKKGPAKIVDLEPGKGMKVGDEISLEDAIEEVRKGGDVIASDRKTARDIALQAGNGTPIHEEAHPSAGPKGRGHFHPADAYGDRMKGVGHVFY